MACVADKIVASPFAVMGSIGVVAQLPNFSKILKKNDIDYEIIRLLKQNGRTPNTEIAKKLNLSEISVNE